MKDLIVLTVFTLCLLGCGSTPVKAPALPANAQFSIPVLTVNLTQIRAVEGYPDEEAFTQLLQKKTESAFKERGLLADVGTTNAFEVAIDVKYQRRFAGEATPFPTKSVMAPLVKYSVIVSKNGVEKHRIERYDMTVNKGFGANLVTTFTLGLGKSAKDEEQDLQILANSFAIELEKLKK